MMFVNVGQENAQGITKHALGIPKKHTESKARGCSLSQKYNDASTSEGLYQLGIDLD